MFSKNKSKAISNIKVKQRNNCQPPQSHYIYGNHLPRICPTKVNISQQSVERIHSSITSNITQSVYAPARVRWPVAHFTAEVGTKAQGTSVTIPPLKYNTHTLLVESLDQYFIIGLAGPLFF